MESHPAAIHGARLAALFATLLLIGCASPGSGGSAGGAAAAQASEPSPPNFKAALDALDRMVPESEKKDFAAGQISMATANKGIGKHFRNAWDLWHDSPLAHYFNARGIHDAEIMSDAILEGWQQRLRTGSYDEKAIIAKHAALEAGAKKW